ncbi:hypothetical protein ACHAXN_003923 [Cyclotella atomus]
MTASWTEESNLGASSYSSNNYPDALVHYTNALDTLLNSSRGDAVEISEGEKKKQHQILLSNVIACRLKIGGEEMVETALVETRECIAIDPNWAKAHIRLASAYIAQGGHSNDACQALQRAISLDRENKVAREMLVKESRRRDNCGSSTSSSYQEGNTSTTNAGDDDGATDETAQQTNAGHSSTASSSTHQQNTNANASTSNNNNQNNIDIDDIYHPNQPNSLSEIMQQYLTRAISWYHSQSDDKKTLIKVSSCFLLLYIALGGRFGLEYAVGRNNKKRGNYGQGNVYERYSNNYNNRQSYSDGQYNYGQRRETAAETTDEYDYSGKSSSVYNDRSNPRNEEYYSQGQGSTYQGRQSTQSSGGYSGSTDRQSTTANTRDGDRYNDRSNPRNSNEQYHSQYTNNDNRQRQSSNYYKISIALR